METVNNLANAASKAIWGDSTISKEPVSGETGNVEAGEPYDAGNIEERGTDKPASAASDGVTSTDTSTSSGISSTTAGLSNQKSSAPVHAGAGTTTDLTSTATWLHDDSGGLASKETPLDASHGIGALGTDRPITEKDMTLNEYNSTGSDTPAGSSAHRQGDSSKNLAQEHEGAGINDSFKGSDSTDKKAQGGYQKTHISGVDKEGDRIVAEKGIVEGPSGTVTGSGTAPMKETPGMAAAVPPPNEHSRKVNEVKEHEGKDHVSLRDRIKEKLHINKP